MPPPPAFWQLSASRCLTLDRPRLLAILNVTPDSFSDGGHYLDPGAALARAEQAAAEGADALDIGAESTRPGAAPVPDTEQVARAVPVIQRIRASPGKAALLPITIDTTRAAVARAALDAGADAVNDQSAGLDDPDMLTLIAQRRCGVVLMHRARPPGADVYSFQYNREPDYGPAGVVEHVAGFLRARASAARHAGIDPSAIVVDPGLGFGKSVAQNWALVNAAGRLLREGYPVLCAASRKSFLVTNPDTDPSQALTSPIPPRQRIAHSIAVAVSQFLAGIRLFRVHDVSEHRDLLHKTSFSVISAQPA